MFIRVVTTIFTTRMKKNITLVLALRQRLRGKYRVTMLQIDFYTTRFPDNGVFIFSTFWGMDNAKENYKSRQDFPLLIGTSLDTFELSAKILIRIEEFHHTKYEMYQYKYRFVRVAKFRRKKSSLYY